MTRLGVLVLLAGCDAVFGLDPVDLPAVVDAAPIDAPPDTPPGCTEHELSANVAADTMLLDVNQCDPSIRYGAATTINVGQNGSSRVLARFVLDDKAVQAINEGVAVRGQLKITLRPNDCSCTNMPANFQIFAATNGWNEGSAAAYDGAGWCHRQRTPSTQGIEWQLHGADGTSDRSQIPLATRAVTAAEVATPGEILTTFELSDTLRGELAARIVGNRLSLILVPTGGGTLFLYSREARAEATQLSITECR